MIHTKLIAGFSMLIQFYKVNRKKLRKEDNYGIYFLKIMLELA